MPTSSLKTSELQLEARWAAYVTGFTPNDDYNLTVSAGESAALINELGVLFRAFHPHNDVRLFPSDRPVFLFWRSHTTGDFVVTRITVAEDNRGMRKALEYFALILSAENLALLWNDPLRAEELELFRFVKEQFKSGRRAHLVLGLAGDEARPLPRAEMFSALADGEATALIGDVPYTARSLQDLERLIRRTSESGRLPPTFATWWQSSKPAPPDYFDVVLRMRPPQGVRLSDVGETVSSLVHDVRTHLPKAPAGDQASGELLGNVLQDATELESVLLETLHNVNRIGPADFTAAMASATVVVDRMAKQTQALSRRLADTPGAVGRTQIEQLSARCRRLSEDLPKLRHPNPFEHSPTALVPVTDESRDARRLARPRAAAAPSASLWNLFAEGRGRIVTVGALMIAILVSSSLLFARKAPVPAPGRGVPHTSVKDDPSPAEQQRELVRQLRLQLVRTAPQIQEAAIRSGRSEGFESTTTPRGGSNDPRTQGYVKKWTARVLNRHYKAAQVLPPGGGLDYETYRETLRTDGIGLVAQVYAAVEEGRQAKAAQLQIEAERAAERAATAKRAAAERALRKAAPSADRSSSLRNRAKRSSPAGKKTPKRKKAVPSQKARPTSPSI